eukprot:4031187-Alexandrium_andersonii.AAC.1
MQLLLLGAFGQQLLAPFWRAAASRAQAYAAAWPALRRKGHRSNEVFTSKATREALGATLASRLRDALP